VFGEVAIAGAAENGVAKMATNANRTEVSIKNEELGGYSAFRK